MMSLLIPLLANKYFRWLGIALLVVAGVLLALARARRKGAAAERLRQQQQSLKNLRERIRNDTEIDALSPSDRRERLNRWVRDDA